MTEPVVLVTGFGPFLDIADNPAACLARAVDARRAGDAWVVGRVLPVSYEAGPALTRAWAESLDAVAIIGLGIARGRTAVCVERTGRRRADPVLFDTDGACLSDLEPGGPDSVTATLDAEAFAATLGAEVSDDAGAYVCNAWLYRVVRALPRCPVLFVHLPPAGLDPDSLLGAIRALRPAGSRA